MKMNFGFVFYPSSISIPCNILTARSLRADGWTMADGWVCLKTLFCSDRPVDRSVALSCTLIKQC